VSSAINDINYITHKVICQGFLEKKFRFFSDLTLFACFTPFIAQKIFFSFSILWTNNALYGICGMAFSKRQFSLSILLYRV